MFYVDPSHFVGTVGSNVFINDLCPVDHTSALKQHIDIRQVWGEDTYTGLNSSDLYSTAIIGIYHLVLILLMGYLTQNSF